jgi:hypothetical protein
MITTLLPGESVGLVYLDGEAVYAPKPLAGFERIELGASAFRFVTFCGDRFDWGQ